MDTLENRAYIFYPFSFVTKYRHDYRDPLAFAHSALVKKLTKGIASPLMDRLGDRLRLGDAVHGPVLEAQATDAPLWKALDQKMVYGQLHSDFDTVVARILYGAEGPTDRKEIARFSGSPPLVLSNDALQGEFLLPLAKSARERLRFSGIDNISAGRLRFRFGEVKAYFFGTGIGLLTFEIEFLALQVASALRSVPSDVVLEALYSITHSADQGQHMDHGSLQSMQVSEDVAEGDALVRRQVEDTAEGKKDSKKKSFVFAKATSEKADGNALHSARKGDDCIIQRKGKLGTFQLPQLAAALLYQGGPTSDSNISSAGQKRLFSFAYLRVKETEDERELQQLVFRLASKFNGEYAVRGSEVARSIVQSFDNIFHCMTTQGGALVVRAGEVAPEHLRTYLSKAVVPAYLPLATLSFHEYLHLKGLTQDGAKLPDHTRPDEEVGRMAKLRNDLIDFRIFYRFSHVSMMSNHNVVHQAWRGALSLDRMLDDLGKDVAEADKVLRKAQEEKKDARWRWFGAFGASAAGFVVTHELLDVALRLIYLQEKWFLLALKGEGRTWPAIENDPSLASAVDFIHNLHQANYWVFGAALAAAIVAGIIGWMKGPKLGEW